MIDLDGTSLIITGAGSGIGLATAAAAKALGARVAGTVQGEAQRNTLAQHLDDAAIFDLDVRDSGAVDRAVQATIARFGGLDGAVGCAGIIELLATTETPDGVWRRVLDVNLTGCFHLARASARHMQARRAGAIVMVSSQIGLTGHRCAAAYAASKAGINGLTKTMAVELGADNVRINAVGPGPIKTDMTVQSWADPERRDWLLQGIPMGRFGEPEEIASVILFLLSGAASFITGQVLCADGGYTAK
jgi:NAD(P)-dependent dehydrogenase (short-subunit alcohol dehydrogenase family)